MRATRGPVVWSLWLWAVLVTGSTYGEEPDLGSPLLQAAGIRGGFVVYLGCADGKLSLALTQQATVSVQGWTIDGTALDKARASITQTGAFKRISVNLWDGKALPYATHLANAVICDQTEKFTPPLQEVLRVLVPNGVGLLGLSALPAGQSEETLLAQWKALLNGVGITEVQVVKQEGLWLCFNKPKPAEFDEWPYWRRAPDGNNVSQDRVAGVPGRLKWIDGPSTHALAIRDQALRSAGGRLFVVAEESEPAIHGPVRPRLSARDAYNGLVLWKRELPSFYTDKPEANFPNYLFPAKAFFATAERLYVVLDKNGPLVALDAASGKSVLEYKEGGAARLAMLLGTLLIVSDGGCVRALDVKTGALLWKTDIAVRSAEETLADWLADDERIILAENSDCVALEIKTGKQLWRTPVPSLNDLCFVCEGVLGVRNARGGKALALSAQTGELLWNYSYDSTEGGRRGWRFSPDFVLDGLYWVHALPNAQEAAAGFAASFVGLDLKTGAEKRRLPHKDVNGSCTPWAFTPSVCLMGKRDYLNFSTGAGGEFDLTRNTCGIGFLLGNGLLYNLPIGCLCVTALRGVMATEPAESFTPDPLDDPRRSVKGTAFGQVAADTDPPRGEAWPIYRSDPQRNGYSPTEVPSDIKQLWHLDFKTAITAPVVSGGRVYLAARDANQVLAVDIESQRTVWIFTVEGCVDTPPTLYQGLCLFGTRAGWVYALRASDGALAWKFRAAPKEHWIMAYGRPESSWPVHGTVLVHQGLAFIAAGRHSDAEGGIWVYALEPQSGKLVWAKNHCSGCPSYRVDLDTGQILDEHEASCNADVRPTASAGGGRARDILMDDILVADGDCVAMRYWCFDVKDGRSAYKGGARFTVLRPGAGMIMETSYAQHSSAGAYSGWNAHGAFGVMLVSDGDKAVFGFTNPKPLGAGIKLFGEPGKFKNAVAGLRSKALALTGSVLWVGGFDERVKPGQNPWAAWDGENGGCVAAFSTLDGLEKARLPLSAIPVWDGMAAAGGRLFVVTKDGKLTCFGK
ncbi:MAG: hypothetical protein AMXMBFR7_43540 [Planctomycetota bacterium]